MSTKRVADLTIDEFRALIREIVQEIFCEMIDGCDPDVGLEFRPEVAKYLMNALHEKRRGIPFEEAMKELDLDDKE